MKHRTKILAMALASTMVISMLPATAMAAEGDKTITILGTSDLHGNIWGYSYEDNKETTNNGMARVYTYVEEVRAENPNTLLVDCGDTVQGTIMTDDLYNKLEEGDHPVISAMNFMKYDAMAMGNHEFNFEQYGLVERIMAQAEFPMLAGNVTNAETGDATYEAYTIKEVDGVNVALIGMTNPNVPTWDGDKVADRAFAALSDSVGAAIDEIGDKADVFVVMAHAGMFAEFDEDHGTDAAQKIIDDNPEVDALLVGHMHILVNETQGDVVIGAPRNAGRDVVRFDLTVAADGAVTGTVAVTDMADYTPNEDLRALDIVTEAHEATIAYVQGGTGEDGEETPPLGTTAAKFQPENEIAGLPAGKLMDTAVMDLINGLQLEASGADVSAAALFADTSDLPEGAINYGNIFSIYKFDNTLYRVTVTGAELKAYMEWSAECYNQWEEGDLNVSFDPEYPGYLYDMFAGVDYEINLSKPKGERIENVMFKGEPLTDDQELTLCVNNYRYASALKAGGLVSGKRDWESAGPIRTMIVDHFAANSPVAPTVDNNWKITGIDLDVENPQRAELIALVNAGLIETPYAASLNIADYDTLVSSIPGVSTVAVGDSTAFRLRDIALALAETDAKFNVTWTADAGVTITTGEAYTEAALESATNQSVDGADLVAITVDGDGILIPAVLIDGNYYVTTAFLARLG